MIKGIILDVDGVIVGEKIDYNSPWPHPDVIAELKRVKSLGIPITLCTAKPHFSIDKIIEDAGLDNLHITDGGGVIIDPIAGKVVAEYNLDFDSATQVIKKLLEENVYTEFYTVDNYYIQESQVADGITPGHRHVLQQDPVIVDDLVVEAGKQKITKIMPIALNEKDKERVVSIMSQFDDLVKTSWGVHPVILPLQFGIVTAHGISKKEAAISIASSLNIPMSDYLGVGDSPSDWQFIELCGYAGAMGNAKQELQDLVKSKSEGNYIVGNSVDENGIIKILQQFIN
jgi:hydroxymethylpyrimidine pyrophosphatase-like HAD family hydrolase